MKFEDALKAMREGKRVTHNRTHHVFFIKNDELTSCIPRYRGNFDLCLSYLGPSKQIMYEDWEIVE